MMITEDFKCPICGGPTAHEERENSQPKSKTILYSCINPECGTKLSHDYDEKTKKYRDGLWLYETKNERSDIWIKYGYQMRTPEEWDRVLKGESLPELKQKVESLWPCDSCGKKVVSVLFPPANIDGEHYCWLCAPHIMDDKLKDVTITTTTGVEGHRIKKYLDIESQEIVIRTGRFREIGTEAADFFGSRLTSFESKLQVARKNALRLLKLKAYEKGANAIVGINMDYVEFSNNRIGVIATGTLVIIEPIS
jgi:uncharacterized protein YbjQ (UPF0145 family)